MGKKESILLIPDAHLLLSSLRSVGYKPETALADIVDNAITAGAKAIQIDFIWDHEKSKIIISDNGVGMLRDDLIKSMKIGSSDPAITRCKNDLGRFGMGLKTAAFSLGKTLSVVSKKDNAYCNASWDLQNIEKANDGQWTLQIEDETSVLGENTIFLDRFNNGTVIIIEMLDKLVDNKELEKSKRNFFKLIETCKRHLSLIFHRFIEEDQIEIKFGENMVIPWNPFVLDNNATQELSEEEYFGEDKIVLIQPYVLPHKTKFESSNEYDCAGGYKGWLAHQGIYVYRNRRLLVTGTWFDFIRKEPAYNLARIKLDIGADSDADWKIDIKKSTATPPMYIRDMLERTIMVCTDASSKVYNSRGTYAKGTESQSLGSVWEQRKNRLGKYVFYINKKHPMLSEIKRRLDSEGVDDINSYLSLVENYAPFMQAGVIEYLNVQQLANDEKFILQKQADLFELKSFIRNFFKNGFAKDEVESIIIGMANYRYLHTDIKLIFKEEKYD